MDLPGRVEGYDPQIRGGPIDCGEYVGPIHDVQVSQEWNTEEGRYDKSVKIMFPSTHCPPVNEGPVFSWGVLVWGKNFYADLGGGRRSVWAPVPLVAYSGADLTPWANAMRATWNKYRVQRPALPSAPHTGQARSVFDRYQAIDFTRKHILDFNTAIIVTSCSAEADIPALEVDGRPNNGGATEIERQIFDRFPSADPATNFGQNTGGKSDRYPRGPGDHLFARPVSTLCIRVHDEVPFPGYRAEQNRIAMATTKKMRYPNIRRVTREADTQLFRIDQFFKGFDRMIEHHRVYEPWAAVGPRTGVRFAVAVPFLIGCDYDPERDPDQIIDDWNRIQGGRTPNPKHLLAAHSYMRLRALRVVEREVRAGRDGYNEVAQAYAHAA